MHWFQEKERQNLLYFLNANFLKIPINLTSFIWMFTFWSFFGSQFIKSSFSTKRKLGRTTPGFSKWRNSYFLLFFFNSWFLHWKEKNIFHQIKISNASSRSRKCFYLCDGIKRYNAWSDNNAASVDLVFFSQFIGFFLLIFKVFDNIKEKKSIRHLKHSALNRLLFFNIREKYFQCFCMILVISSVVNKNPWKYVFFSFAYTFTQNYFNSSFVKSLNFR